MGAGTGGVGGGSARVGGGGGTTAEGAIASTRQPQGAPIDRGIPEAAPPPTAEAYLRDLPPVRNENRWIDSEGKVHTGTAGAPVVNPERFLTDDMAREYLQGEVGIPKLLSIYIEQKGDLRNIASILPEGSRYIHHGIEGVGIKVPDGKGGFTSYRIQYKNSLEPPNPYDIGRAGVYPDWKQKYGNTWVEKREYIPTRPTTLLEQGRTDYLAGKQQELFRNLSYDVSGKPYRTLQEADHYLPGRGTGAALPDYIRTGGDLHLNNWGIDAKGRPRVFDPGAAVRTREETFAGTIGDVL